jgi:peroxiredoxin
LTAEVIWQTGHVDRPESSPVALRLTAGEHEVWIVSVEDYIQDQAYGRFLHGLDEVPFTGDPDFARDLGLPSAHP